MGIFNYSKNADAQKDKRKLYSTCTRNCTCNDQINPLGIDTPSPCFSWQMVSSEQGQRQTAYRILVSESIEGLNTGECCVWDTGKVESSHCINISYDGIALKPRKTYYWKVCQWDKNNNCCSWSENSTFETGLMGRFLGQWIGLQESIDENCDISSPAPMLRTQFYLPKKVQKGRIYLCGLGYHELHVNGIKISHSLLAPGVSHYDKHILYETFDITDFLLERENVIGVILGNGWYNCYTQDPWKFHCAPWRGKPRIWMEAHFELHNGHEIVEVTGPHWKTATGPIIADGLRNGETYDARLERHGWASPGYDDSDFLPARILRQPGGLRLSQQHPPIKVINTLEAQKIYEVERGIWIYDFGKNLSGYITIEAPGFRDACITFRYAERIGENGNIDNTKISQYIESGDFQTDHYFMKGDLIEKWEPRFTYHGFRYVEIAGYPGEHTPSLFKARVVHTDLKMRGDFSCSNDRINLIQQCVKNSTLTNYHGIPTDCPHREKNGWTGDAQLSSEQVLYNFDPRTSYRKWMLDFYDIQRPDGQLPGIVPTGGWGFVWGNGPAWDSAAIIIPWNQYLYDGDITILKNCYEMMKKYVNYLTHMQIEGIVDFGLGDWNAPRGIVKCPVAVTDTAYYYICSELLSKIAAILGREEDAEYYCDLAAHIRANFRREFLDVNEGTVTGNCQTSLACAIYFGMINSDEKDRFLKSLTDEIRKCDNHIDCGILGAKYVMHVLADEEFIDLAYDIVTQKSYPGWGHWIEEGATTLWENWSGDESLNHHMFSDISAFFYRGLAGIRPDPNYPGFRHIILKPRPARDLKWVNAWHDGPYGRITSKWSIKENTFVYECNIPPNSYATLSFPDNLKATSMTHNKKMLKTKGYTFTLKSGRHIFTCEKVNYN